MVPTQLAFIYWIQKHFWTTYIMLPGALVVQDNGQEIK